MPLLAVGPARPARRLAVRNRDTDSEFLAVQAQDIVPATAALARLTNLASEAMRAEGILTGWHGLTDPNLMAKPSLRPSHSVHSACVTGRSHGGPSRPLMGSRTRSDASQAAPRINFPS